MYTVDVVEIFEPNEYRNKLIIQDSERKRYYLDNGEPEDNSFLRDYSWVKEELKRAYDQGLIDGRADASVVKLANPNKLTELEYKKSTTIHKSGKLDIEVEENGSIVSVWYNCLPLPFKECCVDAERAKEMKLMYQNPSLKNNTILGVTIKQE